MKIKTSMTYITALYKKVWRAGYCDLQNIMNGFDATYYNAGVYGWNCDIYTTDAGAITTGYRNMRGERIPDEIIEKYDAAAREILNDRTWKNYDEITTRLNNLRKDFFGELNAL